MLQRVVTVHGDNSITKAIMLVAVEADCDKTHGNAHATITSG